MKLTFPKLIPFLIAFSAIGLACFIQSEFFRRNISFVEEIELRTYDKRVKYARNFSRPYATNLALVQIDEMALKTFDAAWPYPRHMHGRLVRELANQGAKVIGFDIIFGELRPFDPAALLPDNTLFESDEFFAKQMRNAGNVVLAAEAEPIPENLSEDEKEARIGLRVFPPALFATNAMAIGDIAANSDSDGTLRRARAFMDDAEHGRRWHMGIILAAKELDLELDKAIIESDRIILKSTNGTSRIIPADENGFFYINWSIGYHDPRLLRMSYAMPVLLDDLRQTGASDEYLEALEVFREISERTDLGGTNWFNGKLVVVGSTLLGNNLTDRGATPIEKQDFLVSKHWNVANSIITNQFVRRSSTGLNFAIIVVICAAATFLTLRMRPVLASTSVAGILALYVAFCFFIYVRSLNWLPVVVPVIGGVFTHGCIVTYRFRLEQKERRRVKAVFSKIVSPNVVNELLNTEKLSLGGARREITVFFADVRGFTEMTDSHQAQAENYVRENRLAPEAAELHYDKQAQETLATVNTFLGLIADKVKEHSGTLDKYIGDCVMAFWGAPTPNEKHALCCVRAAIDAQRGIHALNQERAVENSRREQENVSRLAAGQPPLEMLPLLSLGSGINTGTVIVGLMGSDEHIVNYTVFGREVNLASRLEGVSGRGRIIIGESTYRHILRDDPVLAATFVELPGVTVKGIKSTVKIYEVPWKMESAPVAQMQNSFEPQTVSKT